MQITIDIDPTDTDTLSLIKDLKAIIRASGLQGTRVASVLLFEITCRRLNIRYDADDLTISDGVGKLRINTLEEELLETVAILLDRWWPRNEDETKQ